MLSGPAYQAYAYSYPHKTAYRPLDEKVSLTALWEQEKRDALFLYVHVPFCRMRCGFCNLFTLVKPDASLPDRYLDALERQITALRSVVDSATFARFAIGGGTPTFLDERQLERLFTLTDFAGIGAQTPIGIECSPETITAEKVKLLAVRGVSRISMGVQSFTELEVKNLARPQSNQGVLTAIDTIRQHSAAVLNLDLIYGIAGQTVASWLDSLKQALTYAPEELYLYPLYVRDATGLGKIKQKAKAVTDLGDVDRVILYRAGRDYLLSQGYEQVSLRMFRRCDVNTPDMPLYSCQQDGMLGLGAGARSYTQSLHYSSEYAVGRHGVKAIIEHYNEQTHNDFSYAHYGIALNANEQQRRFVIQSLLIADGLSLLGYQQRFGHDCFTAFPELSLLLENQLAFIQSGQMLLTAEGFERADSIGPWFTSSTVRAAMRDYELL
uniref:STM4012 family radical SAM protein n=1 Tax=Thaumasiovibrio occultus TaxID=1891184 RepID=UPI00192D035B|nr:STM4012 family radical SAM protein [Thaumasiovibrio occultus]